MIKYYSADYVLPVSTLPVKRGIVAVGVSGEIVNVYEDGSPEIDKKNIEKLDGILVPGFINSHCHLELSHLHKKIPQETGLIPFIENVIQNRHSSKQEIDDAIVRADKEMYDNGIVAVGDICNTLATKPTKLNSSIYYHSFIELICFDPDKAKDVFRAGGELLTQFNPLNGSLVPHAPYTVCKELFRYLNKFCGKSGELLCIHNQETEEENKLYRYKLGGFLDFYKKLNIDIEFFKPQARNSLQSCIPLMAKKAKILLVHNTYTSMKDVYFIRRTNRDISICFCPNANLYIENKLPKIEMFLFDDINLTLGTDSLASNHKLCILSELKTLHKNFPDLALKDTIAWATLNGARYLGIDGQFGSLEPGKKPGLNLITHVNGLNLTANSEVKKLI